MKHTPGPWIYSLTPKGDEAQIYCPKDKLMVAIVSNANFNRKYDEVRANARLVAAAPELLNACEALAEYVSEQWLKEWDNRPNCLRMGENAIEQATANTD